jgi:hypothetical protein
MERSARSWLASGRTIAAFYSSSGIRFRSKKREEERGKSQRIRSSLATRSTAHVIPPEFQEGLFKPRSAFHSDPPPRRLAPRKTDEIDVFTLHQARSDFPIPYHQGTQRAGEVLGVEDLGDDLDYG